MFCSHFIGYLKTQKCIECIAHNMKKYIDKVTHFGLVM